MPKPTHATTPEPAERIDGPPAPPARTGGDGESRATAAAWVAAVGAGLLLAAAGTFLAVSWDALGLTARVAVVAGATGAAILGGHRLRRVLPAVGSVVFHLGALLLPIDALGLAYQLGAGAAARWAAVGITAAVALPLLAVVGRSPWLAAVGLAGLPAVATATGLAGLAPPALVLAGLAMVALGVEIAGPPVEDPGPSAMARRVAAPSLAVTAVAVPLVLAVLHRVVADASVLGSAAAAGWVGPGIPGWVGPGIPGWVGPGWSLPVLVGVLAVAVLVVTATRRHDPALAGLALATGVMATIVTLLPPATPARVLLLLPAVTWLVVEVVTIGTRRHDLWSVPMRGLAGGLEAVASLAIARSVLTLTVGAWWLPPNLDVTVALLGLTLGAAWVLAAQRRILAGVGSPMIVLAWAFAAIELAAAARVLDLAPELVATTLLAGALAMSLVGRLPRSMSAHDLPWAEPTWLVAPVLALGQIALAGLLVLDRSALLVVLAAVPVVLGVQMRAWLANGTRSAVAGVGVTLVGAVILLAQLGLAVEDVSGLPAGLGWLAAVLAGLLLARAVARLEPAADTLRVLAVVGGSLVTVPVWGPARIAVGADPAGLVWVIDLRLAPGALVPAVVLALWLVVEAVRDRRTTTAVLAVPLVVRAVVAGLLGLGSTVTAVGGILLVAAVAAAVAAALAPGGRRAVPGTLAGLAGLLGWALVGAGPLARALLVVAVGLAGVTIGAVRRERVLAHGGGLVATVGVWQLLDLAGVDALDVWLLPVAVHLAVAGSLASRRGVSSWVALVPPLLLVAVPALGERVVGGPGWHGVLAGAVAVAAIVFGGARRLGGPLVVGTGVAVVVVVVETTALAAVVPTWVWLAAAGVGLLVAAAAIERSGGSPVRVVRRAVDVVAERFH